MIFQDFRARDTDFSLSKTLYRLFRIPSYKVLFYYRLAQYYKQSTSMIGHILLIISRYKLEKICYKYSFSLNENLIAGKGLSFPHNGPCVINPSSIIGNNCTIHPNVLIGGDRGKGGRQ